MPSGPHDELFVRLPLEFTVTLNAIKKIVNEAQHFILLKIFAILEIFIRSWGW